MRMGVLCCCGGGRRVSLSLLSSSPLPLAPLPLAPARVAPLLNCDRRVLLSTLAAPLLFHPNRSTCSNASRPPAPTASTQYSTALGANTRTVMPRRSSPGSQGTSPNRGLVPSVLILDRSGYLIVTFSCWLHGDFSARPCPASSSTAVCTRSTAKEAWQPQTGSLGARIVATSTPNRMRAKPRCARVLGGVCAGDLRRPSARSALQKTIRPHGRPNSRPGSPAGPCKHASRCRQRPCLC